MNQKTSAQTQYLPFLLFSLCSFLFILSCLNPVAVDKDEPPEYTADGRLLVNVSLKTSRGGNARSLTPGLAQAGTDYYEAIFVDGSEYHRVAWHKGQSAKIKVPAGNYATVDKAILLAGRFDGRVLTLLAAGELTRVNGTAGTIIDGSTTSVTFTLTALECVIDDTAASGFQITTPPNSGGTTKINGRTIPYFNVPKNDATVQAKLAITGVPAGANYPLKLKGKSVLTSVGYTTELDLPASVEAPIGSGIPADTGVTLDGDSGASLKQDVTLFLKTANIDGWCALAVDVPLSAYAADKGHDVWHLRSGINYTQLDYGTASPGGMTLLRVGNPQGGGLLITSAMPSSYITINGQGTIRLMDEPAWAGADAAGRVALLCDDSGSLTIGGLSFYASDVTELILGGDLAGLTVVPDSFAYEWTSLARVDLSGLSGVVSVGNGFLVNSGLTGVDLSPLSGVTSIGNDFLSGSGNLTNLNLSALSSLDSIGDYFLTSCGFTGALDLSGLTSLKNIGYYFLAWNSSLNSLDLSGLTSLESIGENFLVDCTSLNSLDLSGLVSVTSIEDNFLHGCIGLSEVDMGDITASVFLLTPNGCFDDTGGGDILVKDPGEVTNYENKFPSHSGRFMPR